MLLSRSGNSLPITPPEVLLPCSQNLLLHCNKNQLHVVHMRSRFAFIWRLILFSHPLFKPKMFWTFEIVVLTLLKFKIFEFRICVLRIRAICSFHLISRNDPKNVKWWVQITKCRMWISVLLCYSSYTMFILTQQHNSTLPPLFSKTLLKIRHTRTLRLTRHSLRSWYIVIT